MLRAIDAIHAEEQDRLRRVAEYGLMIQHDRTVSQAQAWVHELMERAKRLAVWERDMSTADWLISLEAEGVVGRQRLRGWVREMVGGDRL